MLGLTGLKLYAAIGAAILLAGLLVTLKVQHGTIGKLRTEVGSLTAKLDTAVSANESQSKSITALEAANKAWSDLGKPVDQIAADLASLEKTKAERDAANQLLKERRRHETPECKAFLDTDVGKLCPVTDAGLRERAAHR